MTIGSCILSQKDVPEDLEEMIATEATVRCKQTDFNYMLAAVAESLIRSEKY